MVKIPDAAEHRRRFAALPLSERRAVVRAVNRGVAVDKRKHAPLAVVLARRQMRLWRWAWVCGAAIGAIGVVDGWQAMLVNALIGTTMLGLVGRHWFVRARRAEQANLALAEGRGRGQKRSSSGRARAGAHATGTAPPARERLRERLGRGRPRRSDPAGR
ncbi:hypothetical protein [Egicoccus halophilus]|uniref:DUF3040 domain-containing protein n=1 Tax=Egicoccus halophilus TaxID=1670830 RepID=A0A8J3AAV0_9ACTN|nr:hypothetical protein [Egicoccus halophilus]GGI09509.1 hypothetical protein GCM10011354_34440 [Egicoccus halophilus]